MPSMADITVKKNDGSTDIVFNAKSGSGGDGSPARWRQDTGVASGIPNGFRAVLEVTSKPNASRTTRQVRVKFTQPWVVQDAASLLYSLKGSCLFDGVWHVPTEMPQNVIDEFASQLANIVDHTLLVSSVKEGYAPT